MPPLTDRITSAKSHVRTLIGYELEELVRAIENMADHKSTDMISDEIMQYFEHFVEPELNTPEGSGLTRKGETE